MGRANRGRRGLLIFENRHSIFSSGSAVIDVSTDYVTGEHARKSLDGEMRSCIAAIGRARCRRGDEQLYPVWSHDDQLKKHPSDPRGIAGVHTGGFLADGLLSLSKSPPVIQLGPPPVIPMALTFRQDASTRLPSWSTRLANSASRDFMNACSVLSVDTSFAGLGDPCIVVAPIHILKDTARCSISFYFRTCHMALATLVSRSPGLVPVG